MSPALAGRFSTTAPPGKPPGLLLLNLMGSQLNRQIPVLLSISVLLEGAEFRCSVCFVMTAVLAAVSWGSVL